MPLTKLDRANLNVRLADIKEEVTKINEKSQSLQFEMAKIHTLLQAKPRNAWNEEMDDSETMKVFKGLKIAK